jgi:hypothetical protein
MTACTSDWERNDDASAQVPLQPPPAALVPVDVTAGPPPEHPATAPTRKTFKIA